jgi:hypothetical protein
MKLTSGRAQLVSGPCVPSRGAARLLITLGVAVLATTMPAAAGALTLSWSGASWNDGGSLSGTFTVDYNDITGAPTSLVSADVVTGNGTSDGFPGQTYLYNVSGYTNTVADADFDAAQAMGAPANELVMYLPSGYGIYLDWQGTDPTTLWVGTVGGQYSSENTPGKSLIRYLNSEGGSAGSSTPEPATVILTGLALVGAGWLRHRQPS